MIGTQEMARKIIRGVGGKAFPSDYDWICSICGYQNRNWESICQACEHEAMVKIWS